MGWVVFANKGNFLVCIGGAAIDAGVKLNRLSFKFLLLPILLGLVIWWWWPSSSTVSIENQTQESNRQALVSAIQPINEADALTQEARLPERQTSADSWQPTTQDQEDFDKATAAIQNGDTSTAEAILSEIISRQPGLLEPYINLASAQATNGELDAARQTLMRGLNANENYGALFKNLQRVHAALAADAYQAALNEIGSKKESQTKKALRLPLVTALNGPVAPQDDSQLTNAISQIQDLQNSLTKSGQELDAANTLLTAREESVRSLNEQLKVAESAARLNGDASTTATNKIASLETRLSAAQQQISAMVNNHEAEVSALQIKLKQQEEDIAEQELLAKEAQKQRNQELLAREAREKEQLEEQRRAQEVARLERQRLAQKKVEDERLAAIALQAKTDSVPTDIPTSGQSQAQAQAIERIKSWALAWSNQDVDDYVGHYQANYVPPGNSINHQTWLEQRRVRLTNKRFIEVTLSGIEAELKGAEMVVTFTQRYRANTMDDTIRKQITLEADEGDWTRARIIAERVLR